MNVEIETGLRIAISKVVGPEVNILAVLPSIQFVFLEISCHSTMLPSDYEGQNRAPETGQPNGGHNEKCDGLTNRKSQL